MMPVDYDLAIVGGTLTGRWAALNAVETGARVVLVESEHPQADITPATQAFLGSFLSQLPQTDLSEARIPANLTRLSLSVAGVDMVQGNPTFEAVQPIQLRIRDRSITARQGVLALPSTIRRYDFPGLADCQPCSPMDLASAPLPGRVALVGEQAATVEWAVALVQRGVEVVCVPPTRRLLFAADQDVQRLVTAQLRALGVRCWQVSKFVAAGNGVEMHLPSGQAPHRVDRVVWTDRGRPDLSPLAVPAVNLSEPLAVNAYLQTLHPGLSAVGTVLGGEDRPALAQAEAAVAVENALFWSRRAMRYDRVHYSVQALTPVGQAGLTEQQARRYYGEAVAIYQSGAPSQCASTEALAYAVDFCKLVVADGRLAGIHLMGVGADVAIALLAPTLGQAPMRLMKPGMGVADGLLAQIDRALAQYRTQQWRPGSWRRDWAENWFNWRRSR